MATVQPSLFPQKASWATVVRSPICAYMEHCGSRAVLGKAIDYGTCVTRPITCLKCGKHGRLSGDRDAVMKGSYVDS